jgi:hypothetical protein
VLLVATDVQVDLLAGENPFVSMVKSIKSVTPVTDELGTDKLADIKLNEGKTESSCVKFNVQLFGMI